MTPIEKKLAAALLDMAADHYGNHGCNDFDLHKYMSPEEAFELQRDMHAWNGDPEDGPETLAHARMTADFFLMGYLANKMESQR